MSEQRAAEFAEWVQDALIQVLGEGAADVKFTEVAELDLGEGPVPSASFEIDFSVKVGVALAVQVAKLELPDSELRAGSLVAAGTAGDHLAEVLMQTASALHNAAPELFMSEDPEVRKAQEESLLLSGIRPDGSLVGNDPITEALDQLAAEGLIEIVPAEEVIGDAEVSEEARGD